MSDQIHILHGDAPEHVHIGDVIFLRATDGQLGVGIAWRTNAAHVPGCPECYQILREFFEKHALNAFDAAMDALRRQQAAKTN